MSFVTFLGFAGDSLTFAGGILLAIDAVLEERRLSQIARWERTIEAPELKSVTITRKGVKLQGKEDIEISFARQSSRRAVWGAVLLTLGFLCLFLCRVGEHRRELKAARLDAAQVSSDNRIVGNPEALIWKRCFG